MKTILTGVQSTGTPHLGNILGSIRPAIDQSKTNKTILFIADIHSLTSIKDAEIRRYNTRAVAASYLALEFDIEKNILFKQSDRPEATELQFYLNCFAPFYMLKANHTFSEDINVGVFTYPTLMAADILLYDADVVPVGKDQLQHLEITRSLARKFNNEYGEIFKVPEPLIQNDVQVVPGTDGRKMSKSYGNTINIFASEKEILKQVKSIVTDSTPVDSIKNPDTCNLFNIFKLVAEKDHVELIKNQYLNGGLAYGKLKMELYSILVEKYAEPRKRFQELMDKNSPEIDRVLKIGKEKAFEISKPKLDLVRNVIGF